MCSLCRIDADEKAYCPTCFERLSSEGVLASSVTRFRNYDGMVAACLLGGILFLIPLGAPAGLLGIYYCIRVFKDKRSRGEREGRFWLAVRLVLCVLLVVGGGGVLGAMFGAFGDFP